MRLFFRFSAGGLPVLLLSLLSLTLPSHGQQPDRPYATIWVYRDHKILGFALPVEVQIGNQPSFSLSVGKAVKYKVYSTGQVTISSSVITAVPLGAYAGAVPMKSTEKITLDLAPGKEYFVRVRAVGKHIQEQTALEAAKDLSADKARPMEENPMAPINLTGQARFVRSLPTSGSGFLINSRGLILTSYRLISKSKQVSVSAVGDDPSTRHQVRIVAADPHNDLALLAPENGALRHDSLLYGVRTQSPETGERVFVLDASAMRTEIRLTDGLVSARNGEAGDVTTLQVSGAEQPGGSPVFDANGNLIGLARTTTEDKKATYATKPDYILALLEAAGHPVLQRSSALAGKPLPEQVRQLTPFVYIVNVSR